MAKIQLAVKISVEIEDNSEIIDKFDITYKALSRKQQKQLGKDNKEILDLFDKNQGIEKRISVMEAEIEALKSMDNPAKVIEISKKLEKAYNEQDKMNSKFETLGGVDKLLEASKNTFELSVGGKDKERIVAFIEENSDFASALSEIQKDANEKKKGN